MRKLGLLGYPLGHSFSKKYYLDKFRKEEIRDIDYDLYAIADVRDFKHLYTDDERFYGFNVTIPHKQAIMPFLDELSAEAEAIQAVNCITVARRNGKPYLKGYNTDTVGFEESLKPLLKPQHHKALVFGNGGAAKAVFYVLQKLNIPYLVVSRTKEKGDLTYSELGGDVLREHQILINCSPVGTFPKVDEAPDIPYDFIGADHLLYDLIYNPEETLFLRRGRERGATTKNGFEMLVIQAEKNWEIWNNEQ
ncbi:shikimate dehydrogenase [Sphingobacterium sp. SGG-5]|uniref:shikimate dehydrogenase family protein n=1 Tax=Sphingobacterium sp. SGG-5 TaxID=2710881 RepID=UPI0013EDBA49|nr:shikimate dehydrogenase [Sphingobacterium sp. SGG-5]NGM62335.1 shikimate dehydrogenase [Sphingobacterium sp. SGG-5]